MLVPCHYQLLCKQNHVMKPHACTLSLPAALWTKSHHETSCLYLVTTSCFVNKITSWNLMLVPCHYQLFCEQNHIMKPHACTLSLPAVLWTKSRHETSCLYLVTTSCFVNKITSWNLMLVPCHYQLFCEQNHVMKPHACTLSLPAVLWTKSRHETSCLYLVTTSCFVNKIMSSNLMLVPCHYQLFCEQNHIMKHACTLSLPAVLSHSALFKRSTPQYISSRSILLNIQLIVTPFHFTINIHISSLNFQVTEPCLIRKISPCLEGASLTSKSLSSHCFLFAPQNYCNIL